MCQSRKRKRKARAANKPPFFYGGRYDFMDIHVAVFAGNDACVLSDKPADVTEHRQLPSFLLYDWPRHYKENYDTTPELKRVGRKRWFTVCIDSNWTIWERIKRYICRVYWLTRNSCYGWAFGTFGITPGIRWVTVRDDGETQFIHEDYDWWWLDGAWRYKSTASICTIFGWTIRWNILLGWKVDEDARVDTRAMIANRIAFSFHKEGK